MIATTTTVLSKPTCTLTVSRRFSSLTPPKPTLFLQFLPSKSVFFGGFGSKVVGSKTMTELVKTSAFRGGGREETLGVQPDALIDESGTQFMTEGFEPTLNRLSKWLIAGIFGVVLLSRHDSEACWAAMGSVVNSILSITLKQILNQERPVSTLRSDPGMPSSHAQSIFFIVVFAVLSTVEQLGINEITVILSALALAFGSYLTWLRVSQQLHTVSQVVVGAIVGSVFCILWYWLWHAIVLEAFIAYLWVRVVVVLGAAALCLCFVLHVVRNWLSDDL